MVKKATKKQTSEVKIFYSWQSDLPSKYTRNAIKDCLRKSAKQIESDVDGPAYGKTLIVDEATRDEPGSPNIPEKILEKILAADVFVADVSIVSQRPGNQTEGMPNSNVVFELGFAAAVLGWERILLVVNEAHGTVKSLPFDFDRHRATPFTFSENTENTKGALADTLRGALSLILRKDPQRPSTNTLDIAQIEHQRDLTNLKWLLGSLHWPTIEDFIEKTPQYLTREATNFYDETKGIVESTLFHIYDPVLKADIHEFFQQWRESMKYDHYTPTANGLLYKFTSSHSTYASQIEKEKEHWEYMQAARLKLHAAMTKLLADIREKFPEIDIQHESRETGKRYDAQMAEIESRFSPLRGLTVPKKKKKKKKK